jgi:molybdate transport system substrate-binding protein
VIASGDAVPITKYANQLIANLANQPGYPSGFAAAVTRNVVSKEDNVKGVVSKVELGEGDAGIVYVTDAKASTKVKTVEVPAAANVPTTYAAVGVKASRNAIAAAAFIAWLTGAEAQGILAKYGFAAPD